jgi:hypothetical protein
MLLQEWYRARSALNKRGEDAFPWLFSARIIDPVPKDGKPVLFIRWLSKKAIIPDIRIVIKSGETISKVPSDPKNYWPKIQRGQEFTNHYIRSIYVPLKRNPSGNENDEGVIRLDGDVSVLAGAVMRTGKCRQYVPIVKLHEIGADNDE